MPNFPRLPTDPQKLDMVDPNCVFGKGRTPLIANMHSFSRHGNGPGLTGGAPPPDTPPAATRRGRIAVVP